MEENATEETVRVLKVIVVGDMGTGKTSLIRKYVDGQFSEYYKITVGVDFASKSIQHDSAKIDLQLWDIAGQERFGSMTGVYFRESVGAIVVFDTTRPSTYEMAKVWYKDIQEKVYTAEGSVVPTILLGNKIDIKPEGWEEKSQEIVEESKKDGYLSFYETSAKEGTNLDEAIESLVHYIVDHGIEPESAKEPKSVEVTEKPKETKNSCC